jgi:hypothetical protein
MTFEAVRRYMQSFDEIASLEWLALTGGEPLLFFDDIQKVLAYAKQCSLKTKLVTNAYWATDEHTALERLKALIDSGLDFLGISADVYHEEYIPLERVKYCLSASRKLNLGHEVAMITGQKDAESTRRILHDLHLDTEGVLVSDKLHLLDTVSYLGILRGRTAVVLMPAQSFGRATAHPERVAWVPAETLKHVTCPMVGRVVSVNPLGHAHWCCCMFGRDGVRNTCFEVGNLTDTTLAEIDGKLRTDPLVAFLAYQGPFELFRHLRDGGVPFAERFSCACDLCLQAFQSVPRPQLEHVARDQASTTEVLKWIVNRERAAAWEDVRRRWRTSACLM